MISAQAAMMTVAALSSRVWTIHPQALMSGLKNIAGTNRSRNPGGRERKALFQFGEQSAVTLH
jgi:hypothetical protein